MNKIIVQQNIRRGGGFFAHKPPRGSGGYRRRRPRNWRRIFSYVLIAASAAFLAGTISFIGLIAWYSRSLPDPNNLHHRTVAETTRIYDRTGKNILYEIHGDEKRTVVNLSDISPDVIHGTIAVEDKDFYNHKGFDIRGIIRAIFVDIVRGGKLQGGSTITQQFIKNSILSREKTISRKLKELMLAYEIERRFSKDEILKLYFNEIPYGSVAYGIEAASETFFGKKANDLTLSEAAILAAIPNAPTYYSPYGSHTDKLLARSRHIIDLMREQGYVTEEQAKAAHSDEPLARIIPKHESIVAPHFVFMVREQLARDLGEQTVEQGGLNIITTLDISKQQIAEKAIALNVDAIKKWNGSTAAALAVNPRNGEVLAMVGSADYFDDGIRGKFNALEGELQPGSSIKPLIYAAAFEKGYTPDTVLYDVQTTFKNYPSDYTPENYDRQEHGPVTMRTALAGSLNIPAVKTLYLVGTDKAIDFLERFGYTNLKDRSIYGLSLVLGGLEVRPIEHIPAFGAFATEGTLYPTKTILKVTDPSGTVLVDNTGAAQGMHVFDEEIARQVNSVLSDNDARSFIFGEHNHLTLADRPVAVKTGTTSKFYDAWTVGYTPSLVFGVWVGNADHSAMKIGADGSKIAAPIWNDFMRQALSSQPVEQFTPPQLITTGKPILDGQKSGQGSARIDKVTGKLATEFTPSELIEERFFGIPHSILFFVEKDDPRGAQPEHPEHDPQFANWEAGVADWATSLHIAFSAPPTEYDDVHVPENVPQVSILSPMENTTIKERAMSVSVSAAARRGVAKVEYSIDGETALSVAYTPFSGTMNIPNRYGKGFHTLTATAFDDVGNRASASVAFNLTAEPAPIEINWKTPTDLQNFSAADAFPADIKFSIDDARGISRLDIYALSKDTGRSYAIGTVDAPSLPSFTFQWKSPPPVGTYALTVEATMNDNSSRSRSITIFIR